MADERGAGRTVTSKVLAILAAFETGPSPRSLTEIAEAAAVPLSTAHRLVGELVHWGALDRDAGGLVRAAAELERHTHALAGTITRENGSPVAETLGAAGCTTVIKPASATPLSIRFVVAALEASGK